MCSQVGYAKLTPEVKSSILGEYAAGIHGIDLEQARVNAENNDLVWARKAVGEFAGTDSPACRDR